MSITDGVREVPSDPESLLLRRGWRHTEVLRDDSYEEHISVRGIGEERVPTVSELGADCLQLFLIWAELHTTIAATRTSYESQLAIVTIEE